MQKELIQKQLFELLRENGFEFQEEENEDIRLDMDSLQFISFIADIEEKFKIIIEDEFLIQNEELYVSDFINMIECSVLSNENNRNREDMGE